jgi:nicotinamide phosphoribosyltransferase
MKTDYIESMMLLDFYKCVHSEMYPEKMTRLVSNFTPRMSRLGAMHKIVVFGIQAFMKKYLVDDFNMNFFARPEEEIVMEYERVIRNAMPSNDKNEVTYNVNKIRSLHRLGYLPLEISALPDGTIVPVKVPILQMVNTHDDFAWLVNSIESLMSCSLWHPMMSATVGVTYRDIVNYHYDKTVEDSIPRARALGDFSMRGQESLESAMASSAAFCLSFLNTATVPAIKYLEKYYDCDVEGNSTGAPVAFGAVSTEHSVMCSNFAVDGDEITMFRRLLKDIYPNTNFSVVSDSYDYWNVVQNLLPQLKKEILDHNGYIAIRGDSGDPVEIVTKTVFLLWETFGGTINSKGYKVLDPHVKALYGDSITPYRCEKIYQILTSNGFACNNVSLGVGSFSMQCFEDSGIMYPFTRDTFGWAMKSTYCEVDGKSIMIFKDPKTDTGNFKKSQKGCVFVSRNSEGELSCQDELTLADLKVLQSRGNDAFVKVFENGFLKGRLSLHEVRKNLWKGKF